MKQGDMLWPKQHVDQRGQLLLPLWGQDPIVLVRFEKYISLDPADCQSEVEDWRWIVLHEGNILWMSEHLLERFFEYR